MIYHNTVPKSMLIVIILYLSNLMFYAPVFSGITYGPLQTTETTWEQVESNYPNALFRDVVFVNVSHGWIIGQVERGLGEGIILHTNDSGITWHEQLYNESQEFRHIEVIDQETLWVAGLGRLFYTTDGGQIWQESVNIGTGTSGIAHVRFMNTTHGWTSTNRILYNTVDGGQSWQIVPSWTFNDTARCIHTSTVGLWIIGFYGIYFSSFNSGIWEQRFNQGGWSMSFVNDREAWAVDDCMLARMVDGQTWISQTLPRPNPFGGFLLPYFSDVAFLDTSNGWLVGQETPIAYTPNGGWDWYVQDAPVESRNRIKSIFLHNQTHGWAAGGNGAILKTTKANTVGTRLWKGLTDQVILSIVGISILGIVGAIALLRHIRQKKRRLITSVPSPNLE
jgi:photosystem II stability/assembly factor-like uncharacterized protein